MKRPMHHAHGFTMVELITVMVLIGVLAAVAIPKLMGDNTTEAAVYGDRVATTLRLAQKAAVAKRRTVCLDTAAGSLRVRTLRGPGSGANACSEPLVGVEDGLFANTNAGIAMSGMPAALRFQPDGTITDANNVQVGEIRIGITASGQSQRTIRIHGGTGYVD